MAIDLPNSLLGKLGTAVGTGLSGGIDQHLNELAQTRLMRLKGQGKQQEAQQQAMNKYSFLRKSLPKEIPDQFIANLAQQPDSAINAFMDRFPELNIDIGQQAGIPAQQAAMQQLQQGPQEQFPGMQMGGQNSPMAQLQQGLQQMQQSGQEEQPQSFKIGGSSRERALQQQQQIADKKLAFGETKEFRQGAEATRKEIKESKPIISQMQGLSRSGKLDSPIYLKALEVFGLDDIAALKNPESQQYQKLENFFLKNLKNVFGARPTQFDVQQYIKGIPTLMNSVEGREKIFNDMKLALNAQEIFIDEYDKVLKENNNIPPLDIARQIDERIGPKLEQLYSKMSFSNQSTFDDLPPAQEAGNNIYEDTETGDLKKVINGQWATVDKQGNPIGGV